MIEIQIWGQKVKMPNIETAFSEAKGHVIKYVESDGGESSGCSPVECVGKYVSVPTWWRLMNGEEHPSLMSPSKTLSVEG